MTVNFRTDYSDQEKGFAITLVSHEKTFWRINVHVVLLDENTFCNVVKSQHNMDRLVFGRENAVLLIIWGAYSTTESFYVESNARAEIRIPT